MLSTHSNKLLAGASVLLLFSGISLAQSGRVQATPTPTPQDETLKILTEEIKLNVLAFDENGGFFKGVTENDLVITENNILHQPSSVRRIPANVLIVMDTGGELRAVKSLDKTRKAALAIIDTLRPGDSIAILQYSDKPEIVQEWTGDKSVATAAIARTNFGRRDAFVEALKMARTFMMRSGLDNKHLVLITDGTDSGGRSSDKFDAFQALLATDITVHVLSYTSMEVEDIEPRTKSTSIPTTKEPAITGMPDEIAATLPNGAKPTGVKIGPKINLDRTLKNKMKDRKVDLEVSEKQLDSIAESTNGEFIVPLNPQEMYDKAYLISKMIDSSYVVTYMPKVPVVGTRGIAERKIDVSSKREGLIVQARRRLVMDVSK